MLAKLHLRKGSAFEKYSGTFVTVIDQRIKPGSHRITVLLPLSKQPGQHVPADFYNNDVIQEFTLV